MPIAFHDDESVHKLGFAAFLHLELDDEAAYGALLFLNARGEPQEFVFNRLELLNSALWREPDRAPGAARRLCASLFPTATLTPRFLLFSPAQVSPVLFGGEGGIRLDIPAGAVWATADDDPEGVETFDGNGEVLRVRLAWTPAPPADELLPLLIQRGLLAEPFQRAAAGLREVYDALA